MEITICTVEKPESGAVVVPASVHLPSKTLFFKDDRTGSAERNFAAEKCRKNPESTQKTPKALKNAEKKYEGNMKKYDYDMGGKL